MTLVATPQEPYFARIFPTYEDIVGHTASFIDARDIDAAGVVCKVWAQAFSNNRVWENFIERDLSRIEAPKNEYEYKQIHHALRPKTYGRKAFEKWLGHVPVTSTPVVSKALLNKFFISDDLDPFAPKQKLKEAYSLVVIPPHVYRPNDEKTYEHKDNKTLFTLLTEGATEEDKPTIESNELKIPLTLRNIILLVETLHPETKIFGYKDDEVLKQCNAAVKKPEAYIMRNEVVLRNTSYTDQKNTVEQTPIGVGKETYKLSPLLVRILYNVFEILERKDCPDNQNPPTYAHTASTVRVGNKDFSVFFGGFAPGAGASVASIYGVRASDFDGVPPAVPAEVQRP